MNPGSPMPPIASSWLKYHSFIAEGWATPYDRNIIAFKDLVPNVATKDTIDLDDQQVFPLFIVFLNDLGKLFCNKYLSSYII